MSGKEGGGRGDISTLNYAMVCCDRFEVLFATAPLEAQA